MNRPRHRGIVPACSSAYHELPETELLQVNRFLHSLQTEPTAAPRQRRARIRIVTFKSPTTRPDSDSRTTVHVR